MWHVTWAYWLSTGLVAADNFTLWCNSESFVTNAKVIVRSPIQGIPSHRMRGRKQISSHIFAQCGSKAQKLVAKKPECNRVHNSKYESCQKVSCWFGSYTQRIYETTWAAAASKSRERDSKRIQQAYTASIYSIYPGKTQVSASCYLRHQIQSSHPAAVQIKPTFSWYMKLDTGCRTTLRAKLDEELSAPDWLLGSTIVFCSHTSPLLRMLSVNEPRSVPVIGMKVHMTIMFIAVYNPN